MGRINNSPKLTKAINDLDKTDWDISKTSRPGVFLRREPRGNGKIFINKDYASDPNTLTYYLAHEIDHARYELEADKKP